MSSKIEIELQLNANFQNERSVCLRDVEWVANVITNNHRSQLELISIGLWVGCCVNPCIKMTIQMRTGREMTFPFIPYYSIYGYVIVCWWVGNKRKHTHKMNHRKTKRLGNELIWMCVCAWPNKNNIKKEHLVYARDNLSQWTKYKNHTYTHSHRWQKQNKPRQRNRYVLPKKKKKQQQSIETCVKIFISSIGRWFVVICVTHS